MPVDAAFSRYDMALLYDGFNEHGADRDFYLSLPGRPMRILDIGCGTGTVTLDLARLGHDVTGLDPADGMLAIARQKDRKGLVEWVHGNAMDFALNKRFDLIIMTGHVFQVFLDDEETRKVLVNAREHLHENGILAFESRNPSKLEWKSWTKDKTATRKVIENIGTVEVHYQVTHEGEEHVTFDTVFTLRDTGEVRLSTSCLRFPSPENIMANLITCGFTNNSCFGGWDRKPLDESSAEIILVASP